MFTVKRNHVIISALVIMIAVAGYLNFTDSGNDYDPGFATTNDDHIAALVLDDYAAQPAAIMGNLFSDWQNVSTTHDTRIATHNQPSGDREPGQAVFVNSRDDSSFFIQAKLSREQARSSQKASLTDMINNSNVEREIRAEAAARHLDLQSRIERETAAEALIESKGFGEVYVRIGDNSVDVVVNKPHLTDPELAQIEDTIRRKTGFALENIFVSPLN
ncbi:MAG: SpoIIIAH-like family protein [Defluviitaleaceae bacterium]|nr:SpoIIIAH-like family protein [Defluviitaleaceae bacterium]